MDMDSTIESGLGVPFIGELGKNLSPSKLRRFHKSGEFGEVGKKELSRVFIFIIPGFRSFVRSMK
jgi:hypothetical protein